MTDFICGVIAGVSAMYGVLAVIEVVRAVRTCRRDHGDDLPPRVSRLINGRYCRVPDCDRLLPLSEWVQWGGYCGWHNITAEADGRGRRR